jgi:hypothetical protein
MRKKGNIDMRVFAIVTTSGKHRDYRTGEEIPVGYPIAMVNQTTLAVFQNRVDAEEVRNSMIYQKAVDTEIREFEMDTLVWRG